MSISFNSVPGNLRVPFLYAEFDGSNAQQGVSIKQYKALMFGQKTSAGSATANAPVAVTKPEDAITLFGRGSILHLMCAKWFQNNKATSLKVIPLADNGSGVAASGTVVFAGTATADGTAVFRIAGQKVEVAVTAGDTAATVASAFNAEVNLLLDLPVTSGVSTATATLTCRHKGLLGNDIDVRTGYEDDGSLPAGITATITQLASGTTAPVLTTAIANMTETQYDVIVFPFQDATSLTAIEAELLDRWGPMRQNDGVAICAKDDTNANLITFGDGRNSKHVVCVGVYNSPSPAFEIAAATAAAVALYGQIDPARPFQTLPLLGILPPSEINQFTLEERNLMLYDGIATVRVDSGGLVLVERLITMYQENGAGASDVAYLDLNSLLTLSFIRWDWRNFILTKYPRHKLASDGVRVGAGQAVMTPKLMKAEAIARFRQWEELGLVEGAEQFKRDLIVERNSGDANRLDVFLPPDLMNQLMVVGTKIGFLL